MFYSKEEAKVHHLEISTSKDTRVSELDISHYNEYDEVELVSQKPKVISHLKYRKKK